MLDAPSPSRSRVTWLDLLAVVAVTIAVFVPVFRTSFAPLDDFIMIVNNTTVTEPSWAHFKSFWAESSFHIYMPLALSTWQFVAWVTHHGTSGKPDFFLPAFGFKLVSVGTHALAAATTVWVLSILTRTRWPAIVGGLIFALHPMQVESVAWTTGLKDEYCGLFTMLTVGLYAKHVERDPASPWGDPWWIGALIAAVLATLSKPTAMVLPALLAAVDWALRRCSLARRFVSLALFLIPSISIAIVILTVQGNTSVARVGVALRPLVAADTYAFYLWKLVWPAQLSVDYGRRPPIILASGAIWWTWIVPAAALVGVLAMRSRRWVLAAVLFIVPVLPVSGITVFDMQQFSTTTDHYVYQSLAGVGLAAALLIARWPKVAGAIGVLTIVVLSVTTWRTADRWGSLEGLYQQMLEENPHSWMARDLLGVLAAARGDLYNTNRLNEASLSDNPRDGAAWESQSGYYLQVCRYKDSAEAAVKAADFLTVPRLITARRLTLLGAKLKDIDLSEKGLKYWLKLEPDNPYVTNMLATVRAEQRREAATRSAAAQ